MTTQQMKEVDVGNTFGVESREDGERAARAVSHALNQDALLADMERKYVLLQSERDTLTVTCSSQQSQLTEVQSDLSGLQKKTMDKDTDLQSTKSQLESLQTHEINSDERIDRMNVEADALREEISRLRKVNHDLSTDFSEIQTKASLSTNSTAPLQYQVSRQQLELDSLTSHSRWLEQQLESSNEQSSTLKTKNSKTLLELKRETDTANQERDESTFELSSVKNQCEKALSKLDFIQKEFRDKQKENADIIQSMEEEMDMERRLTSLTKEQVKKTEDKYRDATRQMESMKKLAHEASNRNQTQFTELQIQLEEKLSQALESSQKRNDESMQGLIENLEALTEEKNKLEESFLTRKPSNRPLLTLPSSGGSPEPLGLTDLYTKLADTEEDLRVEQEDKKRLELYLQRVQLDIEAKAPVLRQQRREYEFAVGQNQEFNIRLKEALQESQATKDEIQRIDSEANEYQIECRELRGENTDLAKQIQALLKQEADKNGLVEFTSIEEMQSQNHRLLQEHRRLSDTVQEMQQLVDTDSIQMRYREAQEELVQLRAERERQATLVSGIVQQRDLYRALLAKTDAKLLEAVGEGSNELVTLKEQTDKWTETKTENQQLIHNIAKLEASLVTEQNLKVGSEERLLRMDSHLAELTITVDKLQRDLSLAHGSKARSDADVTFFEEKCTRLDDTIEKQRTEKSVLNDKRRQLERVNEDLQLSLTQIRSDGATFEQNNQMLEGKMRLTEIQLKTAQLAENRLSEDANSLRMELSKQGSFLQSMQNIESTLSAHSVEERARLEQDLKETKSTLISERTKYKIDLDNWQNKASDLEVEIKNIEKEKGTGLLELANLKDRLADDGVSVKVLAEKCSGLEKSLNAAKIRLGDPDADLSGQDKLESISLELESTKVELNAIKGKVQSYQELAKTSENQLKELMEATETYKVENDSEKEKLKKELNNALKNAEVKQEALQGISMDLDASRGEQDKISCELKNQLAVLKDELEIAVKNKEATDSHVKTLTEEILYYKADAKAATDNYERELSLHATARDSLRKLRSEVENNTILRESAERQCESMKSGVEKERNNWRDIKEKLESFLKTAENRLTESKEQNKILHSQISSLSEAVEKYQSTKLMKTEQLCEVAFDGKQDDEEFTNDEISILRKSVSELREVVRYMKTERDMNESQLDSARRTIERERSSAEITKRSLDEARAELELLQKMSEENNKNDSLSNMTDRLKQAEEQLVLLRESNKLLREESDSIRIEFERTKQEAGVTKATFEPTEHKCRNLEVSNAALEAEKSSLVREVDAWKSRVQSLISKFHQIDPDEHQKALAEVEKTAKECKALRISRDRADKDCLGAKGIMAKLNKDISQLKSSCEATKKELAKETSEKELIAKSIKEKNSVTKKECEDQKIRREKSELALKASQTELNGSNRRMENLTKMLRKYKQIVSDLKTENQKVIDNEQETQKALVKEKQAVKKMTEKKDLQTKQNDVQGRNQGIIENVSETQIASTKKDCEEEAIKQPVKRISGKSNASDGSGGVASDVPIAATKPDDESMAEKVELPTVPTDGFTFAPSNSSEMLSKSTSENKNTPKSENTLLETESRNVSSASLLGTSDEAQDSIVTEVPVTEVKISDQMGNEENLRARLMRRRKELEAKLKRKADEEKIGAQPQAKRVDTGDKCAEKENVSLAVETNISDSKKLTSEDTHKNEVIITPDETPFIIPEKKTFDASNLTKTSDQNKKLSTKPRTELPDPSKTLESTSGGKEGDTKLSQLKSETFLNLQPPGKGNATPFLFGKSSNIKLPIPTAKVSQAPPSIGVFGQDPFSASNTESQNDKNRKRPLFSEEDKASTKIARTEDTNLDETAPSKSKDSGSAEEGEIMD